MKTSTIAILALIGVGFYLYTSSNRAPAPLPSAPPPDVPTRGSVEFGLKLNNLFD